MAEALEMNGQADEALEPIHSHVASEKNEYGRNLAGETKTMILLGGLDAVGKTTLLYW